MARRKVNIQRSLGTRGTPFEQTSNSAIDELTESMSTSEVGFRPTDQRVYEVQLDRIVPDFSQPRHLLPHDLRTSINNQDITPAEAMRELMARAESNDTVALLVLGGKDLAQEEDADIEDTGLLALARSIREIGLRHPLNVYRVDDPSQPDQISYQLGEGERRFWAHNLLVQQGYEQFKLVKCIVEPLPDDEELIHQRQEAENAARVDLPAIARARSMQRIKERLNVELGTRVPGENTIKLPSQRDLQTAVGQQVKTFTGRAIGDRMVRNYLSLLNLSPEAQDLAEAAQLSEKQLRPVMRLKTDEEQLMMIKRIIQENWSGRQVLQKVTDSPPVPSSLREVKQTSVEQRFSKRVLDAAKTMHSLLTLPEENYEEAITTLAARAKEPRMRQALQSLRQTLEEILLRVEDFTSKEITNVTLLSVIPPLDALRRHLPEDKTDQFSAETLTGGQILDRLIAWQKDDSLLASRLEPFFTQIETIAETLRADEFVPPPVLVGEKNPKYPNMIVYEVVSGAAVYWAHELLVSQGESRFRVMSAEIETITLTQDD